MKFVFISHGITKKGLGAIAKLTGKPKNKIKLLYIDTPAKTYPPNVDWLEEAKKELTDYGFKVTVFDIEQAYKEKKDIRKIVFEYDIVSISGGNTFYFLYWAEKVGLKKILQDYLKKGGVLAGESAGVVCQIKDLTPVAWLDKPEKAPGVVKQGLQLTDLIIVPHWAVPNTIKSLKSLRNIMRIRV